MTVKFMLEKMREAGCGVGPGFFQVETCNDLVGGGFRPPDGVRPPMPPLACACEQAHFPGTQGPEFDLSFTISTANCMMRCLRYKKTRLRHAVIYALHVTQWLASAQRAALHRSPAKAIFSMRRVQVHPYTSSCLAKRRCLSGHGLTLRAASRCP